MFTTEQIILYFVIFFSKVIEYALSTLRLIIVANGKKGLGAFLQGIICLIWVVVTGAVVTDVLEDPMKIVMFSLGSAVGSWLGSYLEEKLAIGNIMLTIIVDNELEEKMTEAIRDNGFAVTSMTANGKDKTRTVLMIMVPRKKRRKVVSIIKAIDKEVMIISENASFIHGGYIPEK